MSELEQLRQEAEQLRNQIQVKPFHFGMLTLIYRNLQNLPIYQSILNDFEG